jgi:hypothetical protein
MYNPSSPSPFSLLFGVDHPCPKPSLILIFYILCAHINSHNIILGHIQPLLFWSSFSCFPFNVYFNNNSYCICFLSSYHMPKPSLFSLIFSIDVIPILSLKYSFLILSSLVTLFIHLSILNPATLILCSILLSTVQHSKPYSIVGFATPVKFTFQPYWNTLIA